MTCKDCIHCNVCAINGTDVDNTTLKKELCCGEFKDKLRIIELPCKVTSRFKEKLTKYCYERCVDEL